MLNNKADEIACCEPFILQETLLFDLDAKISIFYGVFDCAQYELQLFTQYGISLPSVIEGSVIKRQAEFLAGRYGAMRVLAEIGYDNLEIPIGSYRNPIWPEGVVASISHTDSQIVCMASLKVDNDYLGVDVEVWLEPKVAMEIKHIVLNERERMFLSKCNLSLSRLISICFSAKESLFKAVFPYVNKYLDFSDSEIIGFSYKNRSITMRLNIFGFKEEVFICSFSVSRDTLLTQIVGRFTSDKLK
ncbi:4'-phosphopantetheinyl transferase superfamily protein [Pseudoalteromonas sp. NBT06-2]|uniref:4'-phosphopantetheinyl transferase family protein n=1 Tax=Pseudoalteromonas sp. NBT06-2 TaxID=2025950 RepID=UPI0014834F46|nr:4'-phosphopantetheinyl transferase superfamily protein [Pseudoalteromonas sp. NBT06-2]